MRTDETDKKDIISHSYIVYQDLQSLQALVKFALFQIDHATPEEFCSFQEEWRTLFTLMQEKITEADDKNGFVSYLAATVGGAQPEEFH